MTNSSPNIRSSRSPLLAAAILGFALGGFFDGILLHQVLQWHHFLSLVPGEVFRDIRVQILADGLFHVAVYAIASIGLVLLWRGRGGFADTDADWKLPAWALFGFAVWQFVDVVGFHWIVGIHRIRVDVPSPLVYDIGWLIVVGLPPLLLGIALLGRAGRPGPGDRGKRAPAIAATLAVATLAAAPLAGLPPRGQTAAVVLFRPGFGPARAFAAVAAIGGRILWTDSSGEVIAFEPGATVNPLRLYGAGALVVGSSQLSAGCLSWSRPASSES